MGFFADIIRDSKKTVGRAATDRSVRVTPAATGLPFGHSDPQEPVAPRNNSLNPIEEPHQTFWEEEVGQSGAARAEAQPSELEDRQVVGPSPLENTEDSDLAKAPEDKRSSPDIGKRKQTGLKNRRDVIVHSRMNRDRDLHGVVSFGKVVYRSEDSSAVKPVSKRPEQSTRGKSVKATHRSWQAGQPSRAGATTPPYPINADGTASIPVRPVPKPENNPPAPEREAAVAGDEDISAQSPIPIEVSFPHAQAPEPFHADSREESTSQAVTQPPVHKPSGPKLHIGLLEVVVLAPENSPGRKTSKSPEGHNFASRYYLRNL